MTKSEKSPEIIAHVELMLELPKILNEDLAEALELFRFATPEFSTRTMVRTMVAEFEARIFILGEFLLKLHENGTESFQLSPEELCVLKSESFTLKRNGDISSTQKFYPFKERMLFIFKLAAKVINPAAVPDTKHPNWSSVTEFVSVRNRLTHPKRLEDLHVTEQEIEHLNRAQDWIRDALTAVFNAGEFAEAMKTMKETHENSTEKGASTRTGIPRASC